MKPRITINLTDEGGIEIWLNEEGRDLLVEKLRCLNEDNDHLHLAPADPAPLGDIEVASRPYRETDKILEWGKIYFRPDKWDRKYFPHVLDDQP